MYVVQKLETHYPQASKTSIGHVVQLLYRSVILLVMMIMITILVLLVISISLCFTELHASKSPREMETPA